MSIVKREVIGNQTLILGDCLHGGDGATLVKTISEGRMGVMPPMAAAVVPARRLRHRRGH